MSPQIISKYNKKKLRSVTLKLEGEKLKEMKKSYQPNWWLNFSFVKVSTRVIQGEAASGLGQTDSI